MIATAQSKVKSNVMLLITSANRLMLAFAEIAYPFFELFLKYVILGIPTNLVFVHGVNASSLNIKTFAKHTVNIRSGSLAKEI
jgi:hypothetical protein